jgi:hypothetical protein
MRRLQSVKAIYYCVHYATPRRRIFDEVKKSKTSREIVSGSEFSSSNVISMDNTTSRGALPTMSSSTTMRGSSGESSSV